MKTILLVSTICLFIGGCCSSTQVSHEQKDSTVTIITADYQTIPAQTDTLKNGRDTVIITKIDTIAQSDTVKVYQTIQQTVTVYKDKVVVHRNEDSVAVLNKQVQHWQTINDSKVTIEKIPFTQKLGWAAWGALCLFGLGILAKALKWI